ncbi:hypothetical protein RHECNPAF_6420065 [Rhizobium etli CNPAF512]|nr:hypothetical protein RHECNPAF_6420065 [Rhizobium etli CNPAF512]
MLQSAPVHLACYLHRTIAREFLLQFHEKKSDYRRKAVSTPLNCARESKRKTDSGHQQRGSSCLIPPVSSRQPRSRQCRCLPARPWPMAKNT